jgi:hypothetical protein
MSAVGEIQQRVDRPAQVEFERRAVEDVPASQKEGRYVAKDVDYVKIFVPYSKDINEMRVDRWFNNLDQYAKQDRIPRDWPANYRKLYQAWKDGQELPLNGTPIRGWGVISPAQQEMLIHLHIVTVEDLANMNDEGSRRVGMGALELKNKARNWLAQLTDKGPLTLKMTQLENENALLKRNLADLQETVSKLLAQSGGDARVTVPIADTIAPNDILDEEPPPPKPRKAREATI